MSQENEDTGGSKIPENKDVFEQFFRTLPDAAVLLDTENRIVDVNDSFVRLFQFTREEVRGKIFNTVIIPPSKGGEADAFNQQVLQGNEVRAETFRLKKDGTAFPVEIVGHPLRKEGKQIGIFGMYRDITDRKMLLDLLMQSESQYKELIERLPDAIVVYQHGVIVYANPSAARLCGYDMSKEMMDKTPFELSFQEDRPVIQHAMEYFEKGKITPPGEMRVMHHKTGRIIPVEAIGAPVLFHGEKALQVILRDLRVRKKTEEEQHLIRLGRIAEGLAHIMRNKGMAIMMNNLVALGEIKKLSLTTSQAEDFLKHSIRSTEELIDTVQRMQYITGKLTARRDQDIELPPFLQKEIQKKINAKMIPPHVHLDLQTTGNDILLVDPIILSDMFTYFIEHALLALQDQFNATIKIDTNTLQHTNDLPKDIQKIPSNSIVHITIFNSPPGIEEKSLATLFEPFAPIKPYADIDGAVLSLAAAQGIIHMYHGQVSVESNIEKGTTFHVYLPVKESAHP